MKALFAALGCLFLASTGFAAPNPPLHCAFLVIDGGGAIADSAGGEFDPASGKALEMKAADFTAKISLYNDMNDWISVRIDKGQGASVGDFPITDTHIVQILLADGESANINCNR